MQEPLGSKPSVGKRLWALRRRRLLVLAALLGSMLAVRLVWGWWAGKQAGAVLADLSRRGRPIDASDLTYAPVPDSDNAWTLQAQAAGGLNTGIDSPRNSNMEFRNFPPFTAEWMKAAEASEQAHGQAFALARRARGRSGVQFRTNAPRPLYKALFRYWSPAKQLANTLGDGAIYQHMRGDDAEAVERISDMLHLSRSLHHDDLLISHLVGVGIDALACETAQIIAPGLYLGTGSATRPATRPVSRQAVSGLIAQLLDEGPLTQGRRSSIATERIIWLEVTREHSGKNWVIRPLADREIVRGLPDYDAAEEAAGQNNMPAVRRSLERVRVEQADVRRFSVLTGGDRLGRDIPRYSRWYLAYAQPFGVYLERSFRVLGERRATAVMLALQLHRGDHGRFPERLEELVPGYLPALPADPFRADGAPMVLVTLKGATPAKGDRPMVYFDAGPDIGVNAEPMFHWMGDFRESRPEGTKRLESIRQYRDLTRFEPPPPPPPVLPEAVDDDPEEAEAPGKDAEVDKGAKQPQGQ